MKKSINITYIIHITSIIQKNACSILIRNAYDTVKNYMLIALKYKKSKKNRKMS